MEPIPMGDTKISHSEDYRYRGLHNPNRYVAIDRKTGMYLRCDCLGLTKNRTYAWSGWARQIEPMLSRFNLNGKVRVEVDNVRHR